MKDVAHEFFTCCRRLETKGIKWKISCILKRIVRIREAKREEQHRIPAVDVKVEERKRKWAVLPLWALSKWKINYGRLFIAHTWNSFSCDSLAAWKSTCKVLAICSDTSADTSWKTLLLHYFLFFICCLFLWYCSVAGSGASLALAATLLLSKKDNTLHYRREKSFLSLRNCCRYEPDVGKLHFFWFILHLPYSNHLEYLEKT